MLSFDDKLYINQLIPTVQGEGPNTGVPSLLIRLQGCNCHCTWCDTKNTWKLSESPLIQTIDVDGFDAFFNNTNDIISKQYIINSLMITGGEPFLYQHNDILLRFLTQHFGRNISMVEIETNGSIINTNSLLFKLVKSQPIQLNISPKLDPQFYIDKNHHTNMCDTIKRILDEQVRINPIFKFVDDHTEETRTTISEMIYDLQLTNVFIMPKTPIFREYKQSNKMQKFHSLLASANKQTLRYCMLNGYRFCNRLHLQLFDDENESF